MKNLSLQHYFLTAVIVFLTACGGGGTTPIESNSSGFPNVAGRYSFNTTDVIGSCTDGSGGSNPPFSANFDVTQNVNVITLTGLSTEPVLGGTLVDSTANTGNIQENSTFITSRTVIAFVDDLGVNVTTRYTTTGEFTTIGWSGTLSYSFSFYGGSCTATTQFTGTKIPVSAKLFTSPTLEYSSADGYGFYNVFSRLLGVE